MKNIDLNENEVKLLKSKMRLLKDHASYKKSDIKLFKSIFDKLEQPTIEVYGRRWFQKTYGNTYNSVRIYVDGVEVANLPFNYGYGDHYRTIALEELVKLNILPKGIDKLGGYELREKYNIKYHVEDVDRKREL